MLAELYRAGLRIHYQGRAADQRAPHLPRHHGSMRVTSAAGRKQASSDILAQLGTR
jgi:hypothetical protein